MAYNTKRLSYNGKQGNQESVLSIRQQVQEMNPSGISSRIQIREQLSEQQNKPIVQPVSKAKRLQKPEHNDDFIGGFTNTMLNGTYHRSRGSELASHFGNIGKSMSQDDDLDYL